MRRGGGGTIVNIASTMAHVGKAFYAPTPPASGPCAG
nr:hypothetical protein [Streptomyces sp. DSM 40971]